MPYAVLAANHDEFQKWLDGQFIYIGDPDTLALLDPEQIKKVVLVGNFREHPIYWTDQLLNFQMEVSAKYYTPKYTWWQTFLRRLGFEATSN